MTNHVVVLVPGALGSVLSRGNEEVWPRPFMNLIAPEEQIKKLLDPKLEPTDVIRSYARSKQYQALIDQLEKWGFREKAAPPTLSIVPYDWRKSYSEAAARIAQTVDTTVALHMDDCTVSIVAHSMGGLAGRYYLESGDFNKGPGFGRVRQLITLGTPHRGAPYALTVALGMERRLFLSGTQIAKVANDPRYPAVYEGLPPLNEPFIWDQDVTAGLEPITLDSNPALTKQLNLSDKNLRAARKFQAKLDIDLRPKAVRYFCFVGSRQPTACATWLFPGTSPPRIERLEQEDSGDGVVPIWSAGLPGIQSRPVGGEHGTIYKNAELLSTLATLLGFQGHALGGAPEAVEIAVRDRVVEPGALFPFLITLPPQKSELTGEIRMERIVEQAQGVSFVPVKGTTHPIAYSGVEAESFSLSTNAPDTTGEYRIAFYDQGRGEPLATDEFFVQAPVRETRD